MQHLLTFTTGLARAPSGPCHQPSPARVSLMVPVTSWVQTVRTFNRGAFVGITRKTLSLFTLGLIDFRSDKERTASYTKALRRQSRKQTKLLREQGRM